MSLETIGLKAILEGGDKYISDLRNAETAEKSLGTASTKLAQDSKSLGDSVKSAGDQVKTISGHFKDLLPALTGVGAAIAGAFAVKDSISAATQLGTEITKMKRELGLTGDEAGKLHAVFAKTGTDFEVAEKGAVKFARGLQGVVDAEDDTGKSGKGLTDSLDGMGIKVTGTDGKMRPFNEILLDVADRFKSMPDGAEKSALAIELFGRNGTALLPVLNKGSEGILAMGEEAKKLGLVLDDKVLSSISKQKLAMREFNEAIESIKVAIGVALIPVLTAGAESGLAVAVAFNEHVLPILKKVVEFITTGFLEGFSEFNNVLRGVLAGIGDAVGPMLELIGTAIGKVMDLLAPFQDVIQTIGVTFISTVAAMSIGIVAAQGAVDAFSEAMSGVDTVITLATSPVGLLVIAIAALVTAVILVIKYWDDLTEMFPILQTGLDAVTGAFKSLVDLIQDSWVGAVSGLLEQGADILQWFADLVSGTVSVSDSFDIAAGAISGFIGDIVGSVGSAIEGVVGFNDTVATAVGNIGEGIAGLVEVFSDGMSTIISIVGEAASDVYDLLSYLDPFAEHSPSLVDQVTRGVDLIVSKYQELPNPLDAVTQATQDLMDTQVDLNGKIDASKAAVEGYKTKIEEATAALNDFKSAKLAEEQPFTAGLEANDTAQAQLQLQIVKLKQQGPLTQQVSSTTVDPKSGKSTTKTETVDTAIGTQVKGLQTQLDALGLQAQQLHLEDKLKIDPLKKQIKDLTDTTKTLTFDEIVKGITDSQTTIDDLLPKQDAEQKQLDAWGEKLKATTELIKLYNLAIKAMTPPEPKAVGAGGGGGGGGAGGAAGAASAKSSLTSALDRIDAAQQAALPAGKKRVTVDPNVAPQGGYVWDSANSRWVDPMHDNAAYKPPPTPKGAKGVPDQIKGAAGDLGGAAGNAAEAVSDQIGKVDWAKVWDGIADGANAVKDALMGIDWSGIAEAGTRLWDGIKDIAKSIHDSVGDTDDWAAAWDDLKTAVKPLIDGFKPLIKELGSSAKTTFGELATAVGKVVKALKEDAVPVLTSLKKVFDAVLPLIAKLAAIQMTEVIAVVKALGLAFKVFGETIGPVLKVVTLGIEAVAKVIEAVAPAVSDLLDGILDGIQVVAALIDGDWSGAWDHFKDLIGDAINYVTDLLKGMGDIWGGVLDIAWDLIKAGAEKAWEAFKQLVLKAIDALKDDLSTRVDAVKTLFSEAWGAIKDKAKEAWDKVKETITGVWDDLKKAIGEKIDALKTDLSTAWDAVKDKAKELWDKFKDAITEVWDALKTAIGEKISDLKTALSTAWDEVKTKADELWGKIKESVGKVVGELRDKVLEHAADLKKKFIQAVEDVLDRVKDIASDFGSAGKAIGVAMIDGLKSAFSNVIGVASDLASSLKRAIVSVINDQVIGRINSIHISFPGVAGFGSFDWSPGIPTIPFARGGLVPGTGNTDSVLARLTPGEFVLSKDIVDIIRRGSVFPAPGTLSMQQPTMGGGVMGQGAPNFTLDMRGSTFSGSPQENAEAIKASFNKMLQQAFGRDAFIAGVRT